MNGVHAKRRENHCQAKIPQKTVYLAYWKSSACCDTIGLCDEDTKNPDFILGADRSSQSQRHVSTTEDIRELAGAGGIDQSGWWVK